MRALPLLTVVACATTQAVPAAVLRARFTAMETVRQELGAAMLSFPWAVEGLYVGESVRAIEWRLQRAGMADVAGTSAATADQRLQVAMPFDTSPDGFAARRGNLVQRFTLATTFVVAAERERRVGANWNGELFAPQLPSISVEPSAGRYSSRVVELDFALLISNDNPFAVRLGGFDYRIEVAGTEITHGRLAHGQELGAASGMQFDIARLVGDPDHQALARTLMAQKSFAYQIVGSIEIAGTAFPVQLDGELSFSQ
jgi:hypothetical protein